MSNSKAKFLAKYKTTLLSTGVPSFDALINGGLAIGTITLIEEDYGNIHCSLLCKHIISCGLTYGQETALVIDEFAPEIYLESLPKIFTEQPTIQALDKLKDLEIAWRYKGLKSVEDDLPGVKESEAIMDNADMSKMSSFIITKESLSENIDDVLQFIGNFLKTKGGMRKPLRIVISSFGSPFWGIADTEQNATRQMFRFIFCLKKLIGGTFTSVVISVNPELFNDTCKRDVFRSFSDYAFKFDAFENPTAVGDKLYNDVTGQIRPLKIPSVNSLEPIFKPNTVIWSYHVRRKKILFKEFSLPPCLSDSTSRTNQSNPSATIVTKNGCGVDF